MTFAVPAQEALRVSIAGQEAAEARRKGAANERFNLMVGPIKLRFQTSFETEANDNIRATGDKPQSDLIFRPQLNVVTVWQVTEKNRLSVSLGVGYAKYLRTTEFDGLFLSPGSDLAFDVYTGDFVFNFHDRFSYSQDVTGDPTISGVGPLSRFENVLGVSMTWDLNKMIITAGYDHSTYLATDQQFSYQDHASDLVNASTMFALNPTVAAGIEIGAGVTDYDEDVFNDSRHISAGPSFRMRVSDYLTLRSSVGYVIYFFDAGGATNGPAQAGGVYADVSFEQRVNAAYSHSVSAGRQLQSGTFAQSSDVTYFRYGMTWRLFRVTSLGASVSYEYVGQSGGQTETADRYGFSVALARPLTQHISTSLRYQYYLRKSNIPLSNYTQNQLVLTLTYAF